MVIGADPTPFRMLRPASGRLAGYHAVGFVLVRFVGLHAACDRIDARTV
jgi:hypothetical protein